MPHTARLEQAQHIACCLVVASLPLPFLWNSVSIWLLVLTWLISRKHKSTWRHLKTQPAYWIWIGFFALHALSYLWSTDKDQSIFDTVGKLSLLVMPVALGAGTNICRKRFEQILAVFIGTMSINGIYSFAMAALRWQLDHDISHFFYHDLVQNHYANAVYTAWYVLTALSALLLCNWEHCFRRGWTILKWLCAAILLTFLIFLSSRMLLAVFILVVIPIYLYGLFRKTKVSWAGILAIIALAGTLVAAITFTGNPIKKRYREVLDRDVQIAYLPDYRDTIPNFNNLTLRLFIWRCGFDNVRTHNLWLKGCGNGDEKILQNARFAELGLDLERQKKGYIFIQNIDLHNMFMESLLTLGIPGLILFAAIMLLPFFFIKKTTQPLFFLSFHVLCFLFMLQESALKTQAGVVFFSFFSAIYWQLVKRNHKKLKSVKNEKIM